MVLTGIDTPRTEINTVIHDDDFELPSMEQSFKSPGLDKGVLAGMKTSKTRRASAGGRVAATPARHRLFGGANRPPGKQEFTPLLKSVQKSNIRRKINKSDGTPDFMGKYGNSPSLPMELDNTQYDESHASGDTTAGPILPTSSVGSTPVMVGRKKGDDGEVLQQEGQMLTLREQERIIDEMKKENFGLKLKVVLLTDRLAKNTPEAQNEAIKENIEIKVERATLKAELKKYKRSMQESEKAITDLKDEIERLKETAEKDLAHGRKNAENDKLIRDLDQRLEEKEKELEQALDQNDLLKEEVDEYLEKLKGLEDQGDEDVVALRKELEARDGLIDEQEEQLDAMQETLKEKEDKIFELQQLADRNKQHAERLEAERKSLEGNNVETLQTANDKVKSLGEAIDQLRSQLQREQSLRQEVIQDRNELESRCNRLEREKESISSERDQLSLERTSLKMERERLQADKENLKDERVRAEQQLETFRDDMRNKSFSYKGKVQERDEARQKLQNDLSKLRQEYVNLRDEFDDLHVSYEGKVLECRNLELRIQELSSDFDREAQVLQEEMEILRNENNAITKTSKDLQAEAVKLKSDANQKDIVTKANKELEAELRKVKSELFQATSEKDLLQHRHDALTTESESLQRDIIRLKSNLQHTQSLLQQEKDLAAANEQALRETYREKTDQLAEAIEKHKAEFDQRKAQYERSVNDWNLQKRQLEARAEKAEANARALQSTINELEQSLQGKEANIQQLNATERDRHRREEEILNGQINELQLEIERRRDTLEQKISECNKLREELRQSKKAEKTLLEKVAMLEDEIEVLNTMLEEDREGANEELTSAKAECQNLRRDLVAVKQDLARAENQHIHAKSDMETLKADFESEIGMQKQLQLQLADTARRLEASKRDNEQLQEQLARVTAEIYQVQAKSKDFESERDELKDQLEEMVNNVGHESTMDNTKIELRKTKNKLELDLQRASDERAFLSQKTRELEVDLDDAYDKAGKEQTKLEKQIWELQAQLKSVVDGRERELREAKRNVAKLEQRIEELQQGSGGRGAEISLLESELATVRGDLVAARKREGENLHKESNARKTVRELRQRIDALEKELFDIRNEALQRSPTSLSTSAANTEAVGSRIAEVDKLRNLLTNANEQIRQFRLHIKQLERQVSARNTEVEKVNYERELLEQELADRKQAHDELHNKNIDGTKSIAELRKRILDLDRRLHDAKLEKHTKSSELAVRQQISEEREELHNHLKTATMEVEQLQSQLESRNEEIKSQMKRQRELELQVRNARSERTKLDQEIQKITQELARAAAKYHRARDRNQQLQTAWDTERKAISQRVRFSETAKGEAVAKSEKEIEELEATLAENENRHFGEIKGLAKQIKYLKAKVSREKNFRADLSFTKSFFLMQIGLYSSCNEAGLRMMEQMGIYPEREIRERRPGLRSVVWGIIALIRMRSRKNAWAVNKELHLKLTKTLDKSRRMGSGARSVNIGGMPNPTIKQL